MESAGDNGGRERRHQIGDVTDNEQLAGMRIEDDLWRDA